MQLIDGARARRWTKGSRYYEVSVLQDLLGDLTVFRAWGRVASPRGGHQVTVCETEANAQTAVCRIEHRRCLRGYTESVVHQGRS